MITYEEAIKLRRSEEVHYGECLQSVGPRGGIKIAIERWRVSGQIKTWKTRSKEWYIPITHGLRNHRYLNHHNAYLFHVGSRCIVKEA